MNGFGRVKISGPWREEEAEVMRGNFRSSGSPTPTTGKLVPIGAKLGAGESGHHTARNQPSKQHGALVFVRAGGGFPKL